MPEIIEKKGIREKLTPLTTYYYNGDLQVSRVSKKKN